MAALPLALVFLVIAHVMALHEVGSNNPDGIDIKKHKDADGHPLDGIPFHPYYTVKDLVGVAGFLLLFCGVIFFAPTFGGLFLESPNFEPANAAANPAAHRAGVVFHAVLRHVARGALVRRHAGLGGAGDGRLDPRAVLRAVAGSLAGELDPLPGSRYTRSC